MNEIELFKLFAQGLTFASLAGGVIAWLTLFHIPRQERRQDARDEASAMRADMREATFINAIKDEETRHAAAEAETRKTAALAADRFQDFFERMLDRFPRCPMIEDGERNHTGNTNGGGIPE